jgi:hypothetical protein
MRPESFDAGLSERWSGWVLDHGLPSLPRSDLTVGESVPVAYWVGPSTAAVLHIRRIADEGENEDLTETDIKLFCLVDKRWEAFGGGGGGWYDVSPLDRRTLASDHVDLNGMNHGSMGSRGCTALWGEVGVDAAMAEVVQAGRVTRRVVEAPVGAIVVCGESAEPFTVRILNADGDVLAEIEEASALDDEPPGASLS